MNETLVARQMEEMGYSKDETEDYLWEIADKAHQERQDADTESTEP